MVGKLDGSDYKVELIDYSEPDNRPKRFYYRPCGMQVGPWPCDEKSQKYYLNKGFLLEPPERELPDKGAVLICPLCGKSFDNLADLINCLEIHKEVKNGIS